MSEKSGIEMIQELIQKVDVLNAKYTDVENLLRQILNRMNQKVPIVGVTEAVTVAESKSACNIGPVTMATAPAKIGDLPKSNSNVKSKVIGKVKDKDGKMLSGINVKVLNGLKNVIKETKSNRAGEWMCFLPPGQYKAEYIFDEKVATVPFNVVLGQTLIRVAQPKLGS
jgi:hypothetical protein